MSIFYPNVNLNNVTEITLNLLKELNVKSLLIDIDNTLTVHNDPNVSLSVKKWINKMLDNGIKIVLLSNNHNIRVSPFAKKLGLDFVADAKKPTAHGFRIGKVKLGEDLTNIAVVGDQIFTDIYGGNRFGVITIRVEPIQTEGNVFFKIKRWAENIVLRGHYKRETKTK